MSKSKPFSVRDRKLDLEYAPPSFNHDEKLIVPISISNLAVHFDIDCAKKRVTGRSRIKFSIPQSGYPFLDLVPEPSRVTIDGKDIDPSHFALLRPAENVGYVRFLNEELNAKASHVLEVEYEIAGSTVIFANGGIRLGLFLNDLARRSFLERYALANLEFDQLPMRMVFELSGARSAHRLFANGEVNELSANAWKIDFPVYFTCSSSYVHLTNRLVAEAREIFPGQEGEIPVTVYGNDAYTVNNALSRVLATMKELEAAFGPYAHQSMLAYIAETGEPGLAGMEYCGATITSPGVLAHEIAHSWFGRGVLPANGNAGWIDEAIATWRDYGYVRAYGAPNRQPVNLAGFSKYRRETTRKAYKFGMLLMSELDFLLRDQGGLRPVLQSLYLAKRRELIDTPFFQKFLEKETGLDLTPIFARYVYGQAVGDIGTAAFDLMASDQEPEFSLAEFARMHNFAAPIGAHRPYTAEELHDLV
jgi:hypothetical protein